MFVYRLHGWIYSMTPTQQLHLHVVNIYSGRDISGTRVRTVLVSESPGKDFSNGKASRKPGVPFSCPTKKGQKNEAGWS